MSEAWISQTRPLGQSMLQQLRQDSLAATVLFNGNGKVGFAPCGLGVAQMQVRNQGEVDTPPCSLAVSMGSGMFEYSHCGPSWLPLCCAMPRVALWAATGQWSHSAAWPFVGQVDAPLCSMVLHGFQQGLYKGYACKGTTC